jgi:hypothetical protein
VASATKLSFQNNARSNDKFDVHQSFCRVNSVNPVKMTQVNGQPTSEASQPEPECNFEGCLIHHYCVRPLPYSRANRSDSCVRSICCGSTCKCCNDSEQVYTDFNAVDVDIQEFDTDFGPTLSTAREGDAWSTTAAAERPQLEGEFAHLQPMVNTLPGNLAQAEISRVVELSKQNADLCSRLKFDLGCTDLIKSVYLKETHAHIQRVYVHSRVLILS